MTLVELLDFTTLLFGGVLTLSLLWWLSTRRPRGLPPGSGPALPLLGHLHLMDKDPRAKFRAWRRQYGDVFSLYMGGRLLVVLNGFPIIKEAFVKFADVFSDRPHMFITDKLCNNKGRRASPGESLAWMELFLYVSTLIQHFRFFPPEPETLPPLEAVFGITYVPKPYKIRAVRRE